MIISMDSRVDTSVKEIKVVIVTSKWSRWTLSTHLSWDNMTTIWQPTSSNDFSWWRHQMETFSALLAICAGNSPVPGKFPAQSPVTRSFDVSFNLCLNKRLGKQSWGWWFKTQSHPLWRQCNVLGKIVVFSLHFTEICFCLSNWHMFSLAPIMNWHRTGDEEPQRMMKPISKAIVHHPHYVAAYF